MTRHFLAAFAALLVLAACGNDGPVKCKGPTDYLEARPGQRIKAPEDLDNLNELREMPIPQISPQEERGEEGGCLDAPPEIIEK